MTQQTKTVEMVAKQAAKKIQRLVENVVGGYDTGDDSMEGIIREAISDAVKGTGAVEALDWSLAWANEGIIYEEATGTNMAPVRVFLEKHRPALTALKALELPDHAERGTKPVIGKGTKQI